MYLNELTPIKILKLTQLNLIFLVDIHMACTMLRTRMFHVVYVFVGCP